MCIALKHLGCNWRCTSLTPMRLLRNPWESQWISATLLNPWEPGLISFLGGFDFSLFAQRLLYGVSVCPLTCCSHRVVWNSPQSREFCDTTFCFQNLKPEKLFQLMEVLDIALILLVLCIRGFEFALYARVSSLNFCCLFAETCENLKCNCLGGCRTDLIR